jgi:hypothetical protein
MVTQQVKEKISAEIDQNTHSDPETGMIVYVFIQCALDKLVEKEKDEYE